MNYLPSPNKSEKELNIYIPDNTEVDTPKFPDIEYKAEVRKVLNTAENLEALLKYSGLSICFNQMTQSNLDQTRTYTFHDQTKGVAGPVSSGLKSDSRGTTYKGAL